MTDASSMKRFGRRGAIAAWIALLSFETLAQVALKAGAEDLAHDPLGLGWLVAAISNPWVVAGIVGYLGAFAAWMVILERLPLSFAFPLTALVILTVALASYLVFGETLTLWRTAGIGLIITGVLVMGLSEP